MKNYCQYYDCLENLYGKHGNIKYCKTHSAHRELTREKRHTMNIKSLKAPFISATRNFLKQAKDVHELNDIASKSEQRMHLKNPFT